MGYIPTDFSYAYTSYDVYLLIKSGATILAKTEIRVIIGAGGAHVNSDPIITSIPVTTVDEDTAYSYTFVAIDVDVGDTLTYSAPTLPT